MTIYVTSAYEYFFKVPCGNYKLKPIRGMLNLLEGWDTLDYYWLDGWNSSTGRRMDVSRRHRVKAGSGVHSASYPEGTIAIFPLVTQAVSLQFEMTFTPSKTEIKNAKIRMRPSGTLYVHCLLSVLMMT